MGVGMWKKTEKIKKDSSNLFLEVIILKGFLHSFSKIPFLQKQARGKCKLAVFLFLRSKQIDR